MCSTGDTAYFFLSSTLIYLLALSGAEKVAAQALGKGVAVGLLEPADGPVAPSELQTHRLGHLRVIIYA